MQNHENTQQDTANKSSETHNSLSSDLNTIIFQEESRHAAHLSQVKQNVYYDFESVKEQINSLSNNKYTLLIQMNLMQ